MAVARTPADRWIDAGLQALASGGPDAVRVETLARTLGVTKGGFYWHFEDRGALLNEMLDAFERAGVDDVIEAVERGGGDARVRLHRLFAITTASKGTRVELAIRDWARRDRSVARRLRRVDNRRMEYLRTLFAEISCDKDEIEIRSMLTMSLYIGSHFVTADHGDRTRADVVRLTEEWLLA
jgi:AcrR family transcriptional regulator